MIPTLLVLGLVFGAFVHDRRSALRAATVVVVVSMSWGIAVGIADDELSSIVGGAALGLTNLIVGALIAVSIRSGARRVSAPTTSN